MTGNEAQPGIGLYQFITDLEDHHVAFRLDHVRPDSVMIDIAVPGERWEVEFFGDGTVEIERFTSDGVTSDQAVLSQMWALAD